MKQNSLKVIFMEKLIEICKYCGLTLKSLRELRMQFLQINTNFNRIR